VGNCQPNDGYNKKIFSAVTEFVTGGGAKKAAKKAARLAEQQAQAQRRMQEVQAARERTKSLREARVRRAEIISAGASQGVLSTGTSAISGGLSSVGAQAGANLAAINTAETGSQVIGNLGSQIAAQQNKMQQLQMQSQAVGNIFSLASGGYTAYKA
jgi:hypothetical protein